MILTKSPAKGWLAMFLLLFSVAAKAQAPATPTLTLMVVPIGNVTYDPIQDPTGHPFASDTAGVSIALQLQDTSNVSIIRVQLSTAARGGQQLLSNDFTFDATTNLPQGTSYRREGFVVYLGLGNFNAFNTLYVSATLVNSSGTSGAATGTFQ